MIDSTDIDRLGTASEELAAMLSEEELKEAALLVFANKQDQPGAKGAGEISEALKLGDLRDRNWSIVACSAVDGSGINEGMDWLVVSCAISRTEETRLTEKQANGSTGFIGGSIHNTSAYLRLVKLYRKRRHCICSLAAGVYSTLTCRPGLQVPARTIAQWAASSLNWRVF